MALQQIISSIFDFPSVSVVMAESVKNNGRCPKTPSKYDTTLFEVSLKNYSNHPKISKEEEPEDQREKTPQIKHLANIMVKYVNSSNQKCRKQRERQQLQKKKQQPASQSNQQISRNSTIPAIYQTEQRPVRSSNKKRESKNAVSRVAENKTQTVQTSQGRNSRSPSPKMNDLNSTSKQKKSRSQNQMEEQQKSCQKPKKIKKEYPLIESRLEEIPEGSSPPSSPSQKFREKTFKRQSIHAGIAYSVLYHEKKWTDTLTMLQTLSDALEQGKETENQRLKKLHHQQMVKKKRHQPNNPDCRCIGRKCWEKFENLSLDKARMQVLETFLTIKCTGNTIQQNSNSKARL